MTGLVNSVINAPALPPSGAVVQVALFQDDTERRIADLEKRLAESEGAYEQLSTYTATLESQIRRLQAEVRIWRERCADFARVSVFSYRGIVRR